MIFTKFTTGVGDKGKLITFWGQKVNGQGNINTKCTFLEEAYWLPVCWRQPSTCNCYWLLRFSCLLQKFLRNTQLNF